MKAEPTSLTAARHRLLEGALLRLARLPDAGEREACRKFLQESGSPLQGAQGILWSLLNTREFLLQH